MKHLVLALFLAVLFNQHLLSVQVEARDDFIRTRGVHFLLNGNPYYANGFNAYWLMYVASDPSQRPKVSASFREAAAHGLTVARTWAFSDGGYRPLQYAPGSYNEQMFKVSFMLIPSINLVSIFTIFKVQYVDDFGSFFLFWNLLKGVGFCNS